MLKRFLSILALNSLLFSGVYADDDILAIASKGQLTSKSAGVKELNLEEKMQVKGGILADRYRLSYVTNRSGDKITMYMYYALSSTSQEQNMGVAFVSNSDTRMSQFTQNYLDFKWLTVVDPNVEIPILLVKYDYKTGKYDTQVSAYNTKYGSIRSINQNFPLIQKIKNSKFHTDIINDASKLRYF